jgi:hypothetical protein
MSTGMEGEPEELIHPKHRKKRIVRNLLMDGSENMMILNAVNLAILRSFDKDGD